MDIVSPEEQRLDGVYQVNRARLVFIVLVMMYRGISGYGRHPISPHRLPMLDVCARIASGRFPNQKVNDVPVSHDYSDSTCQKQIENTAAVVPNTAIWAPLAAD